MINSARATHTHYELQVSPQGDGKLWVELRCGYRIVFAAAIENHLVTPKVQLSLDLDTGDMELQRFEA